MPSKLTTAYVNRQISKAGYKLALHQGSGYLYFDVPQEHWQAWQDCPTRNEQTYSVYVAWLNHCTLQDWLQSARQAHAAIWGADPDQD